MCTMFDTYRHTYCNVDIIITPYEYDVWDPQRVRRIKVQFPCIEIYRFIVITVIIYLLLVRLAVNHCPSCIDFFLFSNHRCRRSTVPIFHSNRFLSLTFFFFFLWFSLFSLGTVASFLIFLGKKKIKKSYQVALQLFFRQTRCTIDPSV